MSPEAALLMTKARRLLQQAQANHDIGIAEQAGRIAYAAAFNAAEALIFERSGRVFKTHKGVRSRFAFLTKVTRASTPLSGAFSKTVSSWSG